jgi:hypothetical protein
MSQRKRSVPAVFENDPITWDRLRGIFGNAKLVQKVTEQQFDGFDEKLVELGHTPHDKIDFDDLWYYHLDLAYQDLQPELFAHLFPVCLMDWHQSLLSNNSCSHGDSEFQSAIIRGNVLERMLSPKQSSQVKDVFHDSMIFRLDQERGFKYDGWRTPAFGWMSRLNSLGLFLDALPRIWKDWWEVETPGRAVSLLQYCSGLMYCEGENPLFGVYQCDTGGGGPYLWEHDSLICDRTWLGENVQFVREFVTADRVSKKVDAAAQRLRNEPEGKTAALMADDLEDRLDLIKRRVHRLPDKLASARPDPWDF